jgi:hypothetical protein
MSDDSWCYIGEDITEVVALQEQLKDKAKSLQEALNIKSRFLATMSHGIYLSLAFLCFFIG